MQVIGIQAQRWDAVRSRVSEEGSTLVPKQKQAWRGDCAGGDNGREPGDAHCRLSRGEVGYLQQSVISEDRIYTFIPAQNQIWLN